MARFGSGVGQFRLLPGTTDESFVKNFPTRINGLIECRKTGFIFTPEFQKEVDVIKNFRIRDTDVWVVTFPRSGTTWTQEMVWLINNDCDFEGAKRFLHHRSPQIEFRSYFTDVEKEVDGRIQVEKMAPKIGILQTLSQLWPMRAKGESILQYSFRILYLIISGKAFDGFTVGMLTKKFVEINASDILDNISSPRVIKSHLPLHYLPEGTLEKSKVIYIARNPKDVIVSHFFHSKSMTFYNFKGDLPTFVDYFINDKVVHGPYFNHVFHAWAQRHHPNMLFLFYEDRKKDLRGEIVKVASFLGKALSEAQIQRLTEHLKFNNQKDNIAVNTDIVYDFGLISEKGQFLRNGKTGDWRNHLSAELDAKIDAWMRTNMQGSDLKFTTDLDYQD